MSNPKILCLPPVANTLRDLGMRFTWVVTVADKLVLVNPFVLCLMRCLLAVSSLFVQRASLTVNIDISDVTNTYYTGKNSKWVWSGSTTITNCRQPRGTARKSRSIITRHQEDKLSKLSLVSHWSGGPSGWDFLSVPTQHQWWILFFSHTRSGFLLFLPMWDYKHPSWVWGWVINLSRGSPIGITRLAEWW